VTSGRYALEFAPKAVRALRKLDRVAGDYRVMYTVDDDRLVVLVVDAGHRRQIYR
jgi:mRNA-degrading endonuclease RelE of RelBE toxin-antitoxin system